MATIRYRSSRNLPGRGRSLSTCSLAGLPAPLA
jgi:hypothetical protein